MSKRDGRKTLALTSLIGLMAALLALPVAPSSAGPLRQTATPVRPTLTPAGPAASIDENPSLAGYVWVNGDVFVPAAGVAVRFAGDGFELAALTDVNGYYQFTQIGQDVGFLNVSGNGNDWKASVKDVALSVPPGSSLRVNFSASQGSPEKGPKLVSVSVLPSLVGAGQTVTTTVKVTNSTGSKLSGVWLTHLLPDGLAISGVTTDRGDALTVGSLVMANLGDMAPGDSATFTISGVAPNDGGPQGNLPIVASLISREGISAQASASLKGMGGPVTLPVTGSNEWLVWAGLALAALLIGAHQARRRRRVAVS